MLGRREERGQEHLRLTDEFVIEPVPAQGAVVGKNLIELDLRRRYGIQVIAVREKGRDRGTIDPERPLAAGDTFIVAGRREDVASFRSAVENLL